MAYPFPMGYQPAAFYPQYQPQAAYQPPAYQQPVSPPPQQAIPSSDDRIFVTGMQEADSWIVQRGQTVRLWDRNGSTFYIKSVSESGQPLPLEVYDYAKRAQDVPVAQRESFNPDDFVRRSEFEELREQVRAAKRPARKTEEKSNEE